jgi:hypothetical protein
MTAITVPAGTVMVCEDLGDGAAREDDAVGAADGVPAALEPMFRSNTRRSTPGAGAGTEAAEGVDAAEGVVATPGC